MTTRVLSLFLALLALAGCGKATGIEGNLLAGLAPWKSRGFSGAERATDGKATRAGDPWKSEYTALLEGSRAEAIWDLGESRTVRFLYLQGDNNDAYQIALSDDGATWSPVWSAQAVAAAGMQARFAEIDGASGRYLRVRALEGDGAFSIGEVAAFSEKPGRWPPPFEQVSAAPPISRERLAISFFGLLAGAFVLAWRDDRRWLLVLPAGALAALAWWIVPAWPPRPYDVSLFKAVLALLAGGVLLRLWRGEGAMRLTPKAGTGMLAAIAVLSVASYYEFGRLNFRNEKEGGRPTFVHTWDMRHYFPLAKYFSELHFDGLYFASAAAWLDDEPGTPASRLQRVRIRDLRDNQVGTLDQFPDQLVEVKARFTPERWEEFRKDMRWFRETMGTGGYLGTMTDHGGNSTPVWVLTAWLIYAALPATELVLTLTGLIDPLLLALMFFCIARTFGTRAMLLSVILFGATDFAKFGATLVGSSLRYDWLATLGLGVCALRTKRWALGGGLIAYGALIRAFPALALIALGFPVLFEVIDFVRANKRAPKLKEIESAVPFLRVAAGATATVVVLVGLSVAIFSWEAGWGAWLEKIVPHAGKPNVNHVGLRTVIAYESANVASKVIDWSNPEPWWRWQQTQNAAWERRQPIYLLAAAALIGMVAWAARRRRLDQTALLGMMIIPALFYPANYYYHFVLLLPLAAVMGREDGDERPDAPFAIVSLAFLAMCAAQFLTLGTRWADECFTWQTWLLLGAFVVTGGTMIEAARARAAAPARGPPRGAPGGGPGAGPGGAFCPRGRGPAPPPRRPPSANARGRRASAGPAGGPPRSGRRGCGPRGGSTRRPPRSVPACRKDPWCPAAQGGASRRSARTRAGRARRRPRALRRRACSRRRRPRGGGCRRLPRS